MDRGHRGGGHAPLARRRGCPSPAARTCSRALPGDVADCARAETHGSALELATTPHDDGRPAPWPSSPRCARRWPSTLETLGVRAAVAGTHPTARWEHIEVSPGARYQYVHASMRELARREPTFGLHVHVAVPGPERALRALNAIRSRLPLLLALSGNSPFWQGRDSGLASARTPAFQVFPRTGPPRGFRDYADYVEAIDVLLRSDAIPEPTFLWWDARLQPAFGTLEVRIMDAQTRVEDTAAIAALVQCLVRTEAGAGDGAARGAEREPLHRRARRDGERADGRAATGAGVRSRTSSTRCSRRARRWPRARLRRRAGARARAGRAPRRDAAAGDGRARPAASRASSRRSATTSRAKPPSRAWRLDPRPGTGEDARLG